MNEQTIITLFILQIAVELATYLKIFWPAKKLFLFMSMLLIGASSGFFIVEYASPYIVLFVVVQAYRIFSLLRIAEDRMSTKRLRKVCLRSSIFLGLLALAAGWIAAEGFNGDVNTAGLILTVLVFAVMRLAVQLFTLLKRLKTGQIKSPSVNLSDDELPTISVCIPARDETDELSDCINSLLSNDYPKLEILVLDDCSQDKTSDVIKSFAHRGVRFIKGKPAPNGWLAKNWAYEQLFEAANAEYVLFCGVDVRLSKTTLRSIASTLAQAKLSMMSVLPYRMNNNSFQIFLQPIRYWRQLTFPKKLKNGYPPTLSSLWIANIDQLKSMGGFQAIRQTIRPEYQFAREFDRAGTYMFAINSSELDVMSTKSLKAQFDTAKRTRYPEYKKRVEYITISTLTNLAVFVLPYFALGFGLSKSNIAIISLATILLATELYMHGRILNAYNRSSNLTSLIFLPLQAIVEIFTENYSMWAYEFSVVEWKGRNICLPVLKATPRLPSIG